MENRSVAFGLTGVGAVVALIAMALRGTTAPSPPAAPAPAAVRADPIQEVDSGSLSAVSSYRRGRDLLSAYLGSGTAAVRAPFRLRVNTLIASIPDPYDSHLDWSYDAYLESYRQAFAAAGYVPDRFWLPARTDSIAFRGTPGRKIAAHDYHPGVFLFRSTNPDSNVAWLVYLVAEVPTSGLRKGAFAAALAERRAIHHDTTGRIVTSAGARDSLLIAGPIFSGASRSMRLMIDEATAADSSIRVVRIVSGSATNYGNRAVLTDGASCARQSTHDGAGPACIDFAATIHSDEAMSRVFVQLVKDLGIPCDRIAVLSESATQYGNTGVKTGAGSTAAGNPTECLKVAFPLNIASLRAEFDRSPQPLERSPTLPGLGEGPRTRLQLEEAAKPRESPVVISRLTVPTLDVVMANVIRTLRERDVRAVVLKATDIRDKLMLAREIRRSMRDVMLFIYENNALFLRPEYEQALRGAMVLTTYPLVLDNQLWTRSGREVQDLLTFPNDAAVGVYNATLALVDPGIRRIEYSSPDDRSTAAVGAIRPPVWVVTVGRGAFYPVRVAPVTGQFGSYVLPNVIRTVPGDAEHGETALLGALMRRSDVLSLFAGLGGVFLYWLVRRIRGLRPRERVRVLGLTCPSTPRQKFFLGLFFWSLACCYLVVVLIVDARHLQTEPDPFDGHSVPILMAGALILCLWLFFYGGRWVWDLVRTEDPFRRLWLWKRPGWLMRRAALSVANEVPSAGPTASIRANTPDNARNEYEQWSALLALAVVSSFGFVFFVVSFSYLASLALLMSAGGVNAVLTMHRISHWGSGVSPLPLIFVFGAGFAMWTWWQFQQTVEFEETTSLESTLDNLDENLDASSQIGRMRGALLRAREALYWFIPDSGILAFVILILATLLYTLTRALPTMERLGAWAPVANALFASTLTLGLLGLVTTATWAIYRLTATWGALERFLNILAETPLVNAFSRLPRTFSQVASVGFIGLRREIDPSYRDEMWMQARTSAGRMREPTRWESGLNRPIAQAFDAVAAASDLDVSQNDTTQLSMRSTLLGNALLSAWRSAGSVADFDKSDPRETPGILPLNSAGMRRAEEYFAVEVFTYVETIMLNLRRLAFFLLLTLVLTVIGLSSYPFQPQSIVKAVFIILTVAAVVTMFVVMTRMSRNVVLSRMTGSDPGKVNWDTSFVLNIAVFGALPLLALLSSEFPSVRSLLFSWADPVVRMVSRM